jgi:hypothetical protein
MNKKYVHKLSFLTNSGNTLYSEFKVIDTRIFLNSESRNGNGNWITLTKESDPTSNLSICTIDKHDLQDSTLYRYPKLTLPRTKMDNIKEKFNVRVTRKIDVADWKVISHKFVTSLSSYSWSSVYNVEKCKEIINKHKAHMSTEVYDGFMQYVNNLQQDDFIELDTNYHWNSGLPSLKNSDEASFTSYNYINSENESIFDDLLASNNLILDSQLNDFIYDDLHILTKEEYVNSRNMIKSDDRENRSLALELLANCNLNKSFDYVSMLFYFYYDYLKDTNNWNSVNVKTLRKALDDFRPHHNNHYGHYYEFYLKALIKHNQFTEFAFEECARYAFHNVVKKHMGMGDDSVFQIDLKAIKVNPKYVEKLKQDNDFFADKIDKALMSL